MITFFFLSVSQFSFHATVVPALICTDIIKLYVYYKYTLCILYVYYRVYFLSRWLSGKEPASQCRSHRFNPESEDPLEEENSKNKQFISCKLCAILSE